MPVLSSQGETGAVESSVPASAKLHFAGHSFKMSVLIRNYLIGLQVLVPERLPMATKDHLLHNIANLHPNRALVRYQAKPRSHFWIPGNFHPPLLVLKSRCHGLCFYFSSPLCRQYVLSLAAHGHCTVYSSVGNNEDNGLSVVVIFLLFSRSHNKSERLKHFRLIEAFSLPPGGRLPNTRLCPLWSA